MRGGGRARCILGRGALVLATAGAAAMAACAARPVEVRPAVAPAPTDTGAAVVQPTPQVGECRGPVDVEILDAAADSRPTANCDESHGTETFFVGTMGEGIEDWPGAHDQAGEVLGRQVDQECSPRHLEYLGFDATVHPNLPPDRLQVFAYYVPTEADFAEGARWFRCDALVEPLSATEATTIDGTLAGIYEGSLPVTYRLCEGRLGLAVACDQDHEIEYLASVVLDDVLDYPRQRGDLDVSAACRTPLLDALDLSAERPDLVFGYLLPSQEAWEAGAKGATCVVGATDGSELAGTLAGIGGSAALPVAD